MQFADPSKELSNSEIKLSIGKLDAWIERHSWRGYDPFDGLSSSWARPLALNSPLLRAILQQVNLKSPVNLRSFLGIRPDVNYKAMAYFAMGYLSLFQMTLDQTYLHKATHCLEWLTEYANCNYSGYCWSNPHDYQSRLFFLPKGVPTVVGSAHAARAFLDAYETLGNQAYLEIAHSTCDFILRDLPRHTEADAICISYIPIANISVHNANMLAAAILMRAYKYTAETELLNTARMAVRYTVGHQRPDGAWYYGEAPNLRWADNFHTGYVLDSLRTYLESGSDDVSAATALKQGIDYFTAHFFGTDGSPYLYADRSYPVDIQGAAQCIETLALQSSSDPKLLALAHKVAGWTIQNMQAPDGHFYFRRYRWGVNKVAHVHWGQATMLHALACLLEASRTRE